MNDPDETSATEALADLMDLHHGDVFVWNGESFKVEDIDDRMGPRDRDSLTVSDPTDFHPQSSRYGHWGVPLFEVFKDWLNHDVKPGRMEVNTDA